MLFKFGMLQIQMVKRFTMVVYGRLRCVVWLERGEGGYKLN